MRNRQNKAISDSANIAKSVRDRIDLGGERVWRISDFENLPFSAVAQALSRLCRLGIIQRLGKGIYFKPRQTAFGPSRPDPSKLRTLPVIGKGIFPSGYAAANLLGFSTQQAAKLEVSTNGLSLPRLIIGKEAIIHTRRPEAWKTLSSEDAAILDFIRQRGSTSEYSPAETVDKLLRLFLEGERFKRLLLIANSEPPRVRAMLGAIGQELGYSEMQLYELRKSLNPLSRFDFGHLIALKYANQWQAKERKT